MTVQEISTRDLFRAASTIESSIEREEVEAARARLVSWGITFEQAIGELERREREA
jgi:hypothetical protein